MKPKHTAVSHHQEQCPFSKLFIFCPAWVLFLLAATLQILAPTFSAPCEDHIPMDQHVLYEISVPPIKYLLSLLEQAPGL